MAGLTISWSCQVVSLRWQTNWRAGRAIVSLSARETSPGKTTDPFPFISCSGITRPVSACYRHTNRWEFLLIFMSVRHKFAKLPSWCIPPRRRWEVLHIRTGDPCPLLRNVFSRSPHLYICRITSKLRKSFGKVDIWFMEELFLALGLFTVCIPPPVRASAGTLTHWFIWEQNYISESLNHSFNWFVLHSWMTALIMSETLNNYSWFIQHWNHGWFTESFIQPVLSITLIHLRLK